MKLLSFWNIASFGLALVGGAVLVNAMPGSRAVAQSQVSNNITPVLEQLTPKRNTPTPQSLSGLLRVGERDYEISLAENVSGQIISSGFIRKVEYGRESRISVFYTPQGIYSSEGLVSKNVQYPGVSVSEITPVPKQDHYGAMAAGMKPAMTGAIAGPGTSGFCMERNSFVFCNWR